MTFQEASSLVSNMSLNPYYYNNELYTAVVVPEIINDRIKFIADLKEGKVTVNDSFEYSSDNNFIVYGYMNKAFNI